MRMRDEGLPRSARLASSPAVDLTESGDTFQTNQDIDIVLISLLKINRLYTNGRDLSRALSGGPKLRPAGL